MIKEYEIIPGRSVGPFELGMTREQIEALNVRPKKELDNNAGVYYPLVDIGEEALQRARHPSPGVNVYYDAAGRCHKIEAVLRYKPAPPIFTLYGRIVNGMTTREVASILGAFAADVRFAYASVRSASAGVCATKWEASDDHIMSIRVVPVKRTQGGS